MQSIVPSPGERGARFTRAQPAAVLYSVVMSAKANEVEPWAYVRDVLTTLATISSRTGSGEPDEAALRALLPDVWLTSHPDARRRWFR